MPMLCRGGLCAWDDQDVTGHALEDEPAFTIGHADDPANGLIVRIRFEDPRAEEAFIERLEREAQVAAG